MSIKATPIVGLVLGLATGVTGCKNPTQTPATTAPTAAQTQDAPEYTVQGIIRAMPQPGDGQGANPITIFHQAIPSFKNRDGEQVGMMAMPMPFTLAEGIDRSAYQVGDKVEFTFTIHWQSAIPTQITAIRKLPADHEINFSPE